MLIRHLSLHDFRSYQRAEFALTDRLTVIVGDNGEGKTNLVEAIAFLAVLESFRGVPSDAMVRHGAERAVIRAEVHHDDGRLVDVSAEISAAGRARVVVNGQRLARGRDILGLLRVTVFSPDDLALVKGGPAERRRFVDDLLVALHPSHDRLRRDLERILRQRTSLLRQAAGRLTPDVALTLDVWDAKLAATGELLGSLRSGLVSELEPLVVKAYEQLSGTPAGVGMTYEPAWREPGLAAALAATRAEDLRRGVTTTGPHRDDVQLELAGLPARTHASQGEQRALALAMRLASHHLVAERVGDRPLLVLDDVLSELDAIRAAALLEHLPAGQILLTTASPLPPSANPELVLTLAPGKATP